MFATITSTKHFLMTQNQPQSHSRESGNPVRQVFIKQNGFGLQKKFNYWIPAFAGMTSSLFEVNTTAIKNFTLLMLEDFEENI
ncbi:MAG: hypothetical protein ABUL58_01705 [Steroidobacter sp.]